MMKKTITALFLWVLVQNAFAQNRFNRDYGFRLGLAAYPTIGWVKPESGKTNGANLGFAYGLLADFNFAENYSFATGLTITTMNGKSTEINPSPYTTNAVSSNPTAYDLKYKLQYIEIPLTVKLKTEKIGLVKWYGQFGLSNDFKIGAKQDAKLGNQQIAQDLNVKKEINFYRAGLIIGGGLEYDVAKSTSVTTGLTFNNGFTDISSDSNRRVKNHYIGINFGVFF